MTDEEFWAEVDATGWKDGKGYREIEAELLKRGLEFCVAFKEAYRAKLNALSTALEAAGFEYCCDLWDDTKAHIVGLGQAEYEAALANPQLAVDRDLKGDYRESFSYSLPDKHTFEMLSEAGLLGRWDRALTAYGGVRSAGELPQLTERLGALCDQLTVESLQDLLPREESLRALAEEIADVARRFGEVGFPAQNKWVVWDLLSDIRRSVGVGFLEEPS